MRIKMRHCYPITLKLDTRRFWSPPHQPGGVSHKDCPKVWPWWRLFGLSWFSFEADQQERSSWTGSHASLWIYTRWGAALAELTIDRTPPRELVRYDAMITCGEGEGVSWRFYSYADAEKFARAVRLMLKRRHLVGDAFVITSTSIHEA